MKADFVNQLRALGFTPQEPVADRVYFEWVVSLGPNMGKKVLVGTMVGDGFPATCPSPPHFKPLDKDWKEHANAVSDSNFGQGWQQYPADNDSILYKQGWRYWSRKFDEWASSEKTAKIYLSHLNKLMMSL